MATQLADKTALDALGIKLISSDNHVNEPRDLFTSRFPAHLKDKAPRVVRGADGGDGWSINGEIPKRNYGLEAMAGDEAVVGEKTDELVAAVQRFAKSR